MIRTIVTISIYMRVVEHAVNSMNDGGIKMTDAGVVPEISNAIKDSGSTTPAINTESYIVMLWQNILSKSRRDSNVEDFKKLYDSTNMITIKERNLTEIVVSMARDMNRAIMKKLKAVENLVDVAEKSYVRFFGHHGGITQNAKKYHNSKNLTICGEQQMDDRRYELLLAKEKQAHNLIISENILRARRECLLLKRDRHFMDLEVNLTYSTVHVPTIIYEGSKEILDSAAWSYFLNSAFLDNYHNDPEITWQYFCGATGLYRTWPGTKWTYPENMPSTKTVDLFDCRVRTWYVKATSSPRDVIILIDSSGSMTGIKRSIAVQTVETILDTLSDDDFVNILSFSNDVQYVDNCFDQGLVQATVENRKHLRDAIDKLSTKDIAHFSKAIERAFTILNAARVNISRTENVKCVCQSHYTGNYSSIEEARCKKAEKSCDLKNIFLDSSACNKMIMVVTDGASENAEEVFKKYNWKPDYNSTCHAKETRVFTYLIGREQGNERSVKWMACGNKGFHAHVSTLEDIQDKVQDYIPVIARPIALSGDHVTVWSSVFLDVEKNDPLKTYKWYPYKLNDRAMTMEQFKDKQKPFHLMISVAQPAFAKLPNETEKGGLLGVVAVDIPVRLLHEFAPIYRLGVHGYSFLINHNGYVIYHPDLQPVLGEYRKRNYNSIDVDALEIPADLDDYEYPLPDSPIQDLRREMIMGYTGHRKALVKRMFDEMRRVEVATNSYYFSTLGDKNSNPFSLGIAVREPYGAYDVWTKNLKRKTIETAKKFSLNKQVVFSSWVYCNSTIENRPENQDLPVFYYLQEKLINATLPSCNTSSNKQLINRLVVDLSLLSDFQVSQQRRKESQLKDKLEQSLNESVSFIATSSGIAYYWCKDECTEKQSIIARGFLTRNRHTIDSVYYERTVNFTHEKWRDEHSTKTMKKKLSPSDYFLFSLFHTRIPSSSESYNDTILTMMVASTSIWIHNTSIPMAVVGTIMPHDELFKNQFIDNLSFFCGSRITSECFLLDEHAYIVAHGPKEYHQEDVGKFFGEVNGFVMNDLLEKGYFKRIPVFDFQGVCAPGRPVNVAPASSANVPVLQKVDFIWPLLSIYYGIIRILTTSILLCSTIISRAVDRESLYDILRTHIDFRKPLMLFSNASVSQVTFLEACIERQHLYISNMKNGRAVEATRICLTPNSTNSSTVTRYRILPLPNSNLLFLYITRSSACESNENFKIERKPVKMTEEAQCIRLRSTPYRERPQKCYFVNDAEQGKECASRQANNMDSLVILLFIATMYYSGCCNT